VFSAAVNLGFLDWSRYFFSFKWLLIYPHEAEWYPFQADYYSENLVEPGLEPGTSDRYTKEAVYVMIILK
jgi:hypothetical protein